jgi:putative drug exporter of the RND superfamily
MRRIALYCQGHKAIVVGAWLALVVGLSTLSGMLGGEARDDYDLPGTESHRATTLLADAGLDFKAGSQAQVVVAADAGLQDERYRQQVGRIIADVATALPDAEVVSPYSSEGRGQLAPDGTIGYVAVNLPELEADELADVQEELLAVRDKHDDEDLTVEIGGVNPEATAEGPPSELIGIVASVVILLFAFGSVLAMTLPIAVGVFGAVSGVAAVGLGANWIDMPTFAAPVAAMIAIGVGIDYALLVVTRFREGLQDGHSTVDAVVRAQETAGRAVLFAGITVVIASLGLVLMDLKMITGVALGIAAAVLLTMLAAVTLLPAMLALVGHRIDNLAVRRRRDPSGTTGPAHRWSRLIQRRPLPWALAAAALLVLLSVPALDMRLGFGDAGTRPVSDTGRRAYDLLAEGFGAGASGPLVVAVELAPGAGPQSVEHLADAVGSTDGVAQVSPPLVTAEGYGVIQVIPDTGPRDEETTELVHRLRDQVIPEAMTADMREVALGGTTTAAVDFADYTAERLPYFLAVVLGLAMLLLMAVFRGVLVAVKAVVVNLLSIAASFGTVVAVFQWGWGVELLDLGASAPFEAWAPMMLIAIVFGLSMDYEVFLLSRIREEYDRTGDNAQAVSEGLARTARVITAAAAIMVCVFGSFVLGSSRELQLFGFGLAFAVLIDATVVRLVLVPSMMEMLGDRNWWLPSWLDRILPRVTIERVPESSGREVGSSR